jgi:type II secretory pathway pseudopilin PulG
MALIGILATLGMLTAQGLIQRARAGATATQMAFIRTGLLNYATNCGGLPLTGKSSGDPGLVARPTGSTCWNGPYLVRWPATTPFGKGTTFQYQGQKGTMAVLRAVSLARSDTAIAAGVRAVDAVARAVVESRDPSGRYPESLAPALSRLSPR